jgi:hypothetical protein
MAQDETGKIGKGALDARVETQTLYLMEMMRRLGVSRGAARGEAERAAQADAEAVCAACPEQGACAALLATEPALDDPPGFCANADFVRLRRVH